MRVQRQKGYRRAKKQNTRRFNMEIPMGLDDRVAAVSGNMKIHYVTQCLLVEYITNPEVQKNIAARLQAWREKR